MNRVDILQAPTRQKFDPKWGPLLLGLILGLLVGSAVVGMTRALATRPVPIGELAGRLSVLLEDRDPVRRAGAIAQMLDRVSPGEQTADLEPVRAEIRRRFEASRLLQDGDVEFALFGAWWARSDPEAAYRWTQDSPRAGARRVRAAVFDEWGARDPSGAVRAAQADRSEGRRQDALVAAITGADRANLPKSAGLIAALEEITNRIDRRMALQELIRRQLRRQSPAEILSWLAESSVGGEELAEDWNAAAAVAIAAVDPVLATESLSALARSGRALPQGVLESVASNLSSDDPVAALGWLATLEPSEERSDVVRSIYRSWLGREYAAALAWAAERADLPEDWFDPIRANYAFILGHKEPEAGLRLLFQLPIGEERALYVQQVFARWKGKDPEAAEVWLQQADLPEFRRQELRGVQATPPRFSRKSSS